LFILKLKPNHYNLVILGSGSTAFAAALRAEELGKTSVMTEERMIGGTCEPWLSALEKPDRGGETHPRMHAIHAVRGSTQRRSVLIFASSLSKRTKSSTAIAKKNTKA